MLMRRLARPLLATAFIAEGLDTLANPQHRTKAAADRVQQAKRVLPDRYADRFPEPERAVRINAMVQVGGGALLAFGRVPRLAAGLLAATVIPATITEQDFWAETDPALKSAKRLAFLKDLSLLGGLLIAAGDKGGRGTPAWHEFAERAAAGTAELADSAQTKGSHLAELAQDRGSHLAELAQDRGSHLAELAQHRGAHLADVAKDRGAHLAEVARDRGGELSEVVKDRGAVLSEVVKDKGAALSEVARDRGAVLAEVVRDRGSELAEVVKDRGADLGEVVKDRGAELADEVKERDGRRRVRSGWRA
ncbi:DoxX family protein [Nocardia sp. NBC_01503]|uniref:DoxX family protein n=1 Tax=Nocardia sp. NBC_01503 TaxID=2975997 RepID=UPI002E7C3574|nr:DoxX family protein [Nocardia sp. NBC_01503]WTL32215.1 DoxX family protein [Nocardia sp. NBC_01503]